MKLIPVIVMAAIAASCGSAKKTADAAPVGPDVVPAVAPEVPQSGNVMKKPDVSVEKLEFSMNFFKEAYAQSSKGDIVLSPYSAGMAFSMLADGAKGATRDGLVASLSRSSYYGEFPYADSLNTVKTANSLWLNKGFKAKDSYISTLKNGYAAQFYSADAGDPFTPEAINGWCSKHTEGLISHIIDELDPSIRAILMNALYFKAPWLTAFNEKSTFKEVFHGEAGDAEVDFMHKTSKSFEYALLPGCKVVNLPYKNKKYAMLFAIPDDMDKTVKELNAVKFQEILKKLRWGQEVVLSLPKFKVEFTKVLNDIMGKLGASLAFNPAGDLSGISDERLFVSKAVQKCVLEVNEEGAEAAAVTAILLGRTSVAVQDPPVVIRVDKPFLFFIYDTTSQMILFEGKIANI